MHPITDPAQLGAFLIARRKSLELSQTQVARRMALSQNRISELESRPGTMTVAQLLALAATLGLALHIDTAPDGS